jgi:hypothetical protein
LNDSKLLGRHEDKCFVLADSLNGSFKNFLRLTGEPATPESAVPFLQQFGKCNVRSLKNAVAADPEISKVGPNVFSLKTWGHSEYSNLVSAMVTYLQVNGPTELSYLQSNLQQSFGANKSSISMYAQMHPKFYVESGVVRLRRPEEKDYFGLKIDQEASCFPTERGWCWRVNVDFDVLRGSGFACPKGLAEYIGLIPGEQIIFKSTSVPITFSWNGMNPTVSSLRSVAQSLSCDKDDYLFLDLELDTSIVHFAMRPGHQPSIETSENLRNYLCSENSQPIERLLQSRFNSRLSGLPLLNFLLNRAIATGSDRLEIYLKELLHQFTGQDDYP